jgi:hypothetical protein
MCILLTPSSDQVKGCHKFLELCSGVSETSILLGFHAASLGKCFPTFQDNTVVSSSKVEMSKNNGVEHFNPLS